MKVSRATFVLYRRRDAQFSLTHGRMCLVLVVRNLLKIGSIARQIASQKTNLARLGIGPEPDLMGLVRSCLSVVTHSPHAAPDGGSRQEGRKERNLGLTRTTNRSFDRPLIVPILDSSLAHLHGFLSITHFPPLPPEADEDGV
jgi:hypothetical protein